MDPNNPLTKSFDQFDQNPGRLSRRSRLVLNALIKLIICISAVKLFAILVSAQKPLKLYLIETYVFDERQQHVLDIGLFYVHIGHYLSFSYWTNLTVRQLECFSFLFFFSNFDDLCRHYQRRYSLDRTSTKIFVSKYRLFTSFVRPIAVAYAGFLVGTVLRCSYKSYHTLGLDYFLSFGIVLTVITSASYVLVDLFAVTKYVLVYVSCEFLFLRLRAINQMVCGFFIRKTKSSFSCPNNLIKFDKLNPITAKMLHSLNDVARQCKEINAVLDNSTSKMILGVYIALLGLPVGDCLL